MPELDIAVRYDEVRDRGDKWLSPVMKTFFHQRLSDNHVLFTEEQKKLVNA